MRRLTPLRGLLADLEADAPSVTAWHVGMYGFTAVATLAIFGHEQPKTGPVSRFMMQIAVLAGFCTAHPVNAWLLAKGITERM
jgi:Domain of unknown function (DUF4396)